MSILAVRSLLLLASACHLVSSSAIPENVGIYGGHNISITQAPSYAKFNGRYEYIMCGACIVHERFLVTAGHCGAFATNPKNYIVVVGTDVNEEGQGQRYELEKVFVHPNYTTNGSIFYFNIDYDIAVIKLAKNLSFSERVKPIKMADADLVLEEGDVLEAVGFGEKENSELPKYLLAVNENFFDHKKCGEIFQEHNLSLTDRFLCARGELGKSVCHGDSGGPLIFKDTLVGIVSYAPSCDGSLPQAYTSISALRSFIDDTIKNNL